MSVVSQNPEVSVTMPTFNSLRFVDSAVLSILSQTHQDWELLAYDDCSDDGTFERMQYWSSVDDRIAVERPFEEHGHYTEICNQMIADSKGGFSARMDADDISLPNRLTTELDFLQRNRAAVLVGSMAVCIIGDQGKPVDDYPWIAKCVEPVASNDQPVNEHLRTFNRLVHSSILARTSDVVKVGGYEDLFPLEDWDLALKLADIGLVYVLPDILTIKRQHGGNTSIAHPNFQKNLSAIKNKHGLQFEKLPRISEL
jgi:glycosyltransferase involved in cell wall biosynthesis